MYRAVEATRDILPGEIERWQFIEETARELFRRYGFREVRTPIFEFTGLFARSVGEQTDIVSKEMYTFTDRGDRSLTLRPEGTAPAVRAYLQHQIHKKADLTRWYYAGPMFRYERKQKGRYRQFSQIGAEVIGSSLPAVDSEVLDMVTCFLEHLGVRETVLHLNSLGCVRCRPGYRERLREALEAVIGSYCTNCQTRFQSNILRVLDCKLDEKRREGLPSILDHLCDECHEHFHQVQQDLDDLKVVYRLDPGIVRGLDYYSRTAFEVTAAGLGAQNAILGGGRYDQLVESLGGPPLPAFGFALGLDRLVMLLSEEDGKPVPDDLFVVCVGQEARRRGRLVASALRRKGLRVSLDPGERSVKAQMRRAQRTAARFTLFLGESELTDQRLNLRRLSDGRETTYPASETNTLVEEILRERP